MGLPLKSLWKFLRNVAVQLINDAGYAAHVTPQLRELTGYHCVSGAIQVVGCYLAHKLRSTCTQTSCLSCSFLWSTALSPKISVATAQLAGWHYIEFSQLCWCHWSLLHHFMEDGGRSNLPQAVSRNQMHRGRWASISHWESKDKLKKQPNGRHPFCFLPAEGQP